MMLTWRWYNFTATLRRDLGHKMHKLLYDCDMAKVKSMLDTPDERITVGLREFNSKVFSPDGLVHKILSTTTSMGIRNR